MEADRITSGRRIGDSTGAARLSGNAPKSVSPGVHPARRRVFVVLTGLERELRFGGELGQGPRGTAATPGKQRRELGK